MTLVRLPPHADGGSLFETKQQFEFEPGDHNLISWAYDPALAQSGTAGTGGLLYLIKLKILSRVLVSNIHMAVSTAGNTLTSGGCFAGLYAPNGALLGQTASQHTAWTTTGLKTMALTASVTINTPYCYVGFFSTGTTQPAFSRSSAINAAFLNVGLATPNLRFATSNSGLTTALPNPFQTTQTAGQSSYWAALS